VVDKTKKTTAIHSAGKHFKNFRYSILIKFTSTAATFLQHI